MTGRAREALTKEQLTGLTAAVLSALGRVLKTEVRASPETRALIAEALVEYGHKRIIDFVEGEVRRLRGKPDFHGLLAPSQMFNRRTLHDRFAVATSNLSSPDAAYESARASGGSTGCEYLDDALPMLRGLLSRDDYESVVAWDSSDRPQAKANRIRLRATVHDSRGAPLEESVMREARPSAACVKLFTGRGEMTVDIELEMRQWEAWTTGRRLRLIPLGPRHAEVLHEHLHAIRTALHESFGQHARELVPALSIAPVPGETAQRELVHVGGEDRRTEARGQ